MSDLEGRIKDTLDRLGERPDPGRVLERVGKRKRHFRLMHRVQTAALVVAVLAGVAGGMYGLSRAFGVGPVRPAHQPPSILPSPSTSPTPGVATCSGGAGRLAATPLGGAAGTISTLWQVTNTGGSPCRSNGYPGMSFHTPSGWLTVRVHRGGYPNISQPPTSIEVPPGGSLYFVSYWGDATTQAGPCRSFDRVRVTLPGDDVPAEVAASGCLAPTSVRVGPVTRTPPS
jgi:Protein of unknown function (DUF4232)